MKIRYYCHAGQGTGYGIAATQLALALVEAGAQLDLIPLEPRGAPSSRFEGAAAPLAPHVRPISWDEPADATIIHTLPIDCVTVVKNADLENRAWPHIAYTTWEAVTVPNEIEGDLRRRGYFHDLWVPSEATAEVFRDDPEGDDDDWTRGVFVLPHTFTRRPPIERPPRSMETYRFYYIGAWSARKNVPGLLRAYAHEFGPNDPVELTIHSQVSLESFLAALASTGLQQSELPKIRLSNERLDDEALWRRLHLEHDCFVTATRGESWNLPAFDAMLAGNMIIAPHRMGHEEFLQHTNYLSVLCHRQPAIVDVLGMNRGANGTVFADVQGAQGLTSQSRWLDPDLVDLGITMRQASRERPPLLATSHDIDKRFGHAAVATLAIDRITLLKERYG